MTWLTIWIPDTLDHNLAFSVRFSNHHLNTGAFDNWTQIYLLNTRLVWYSDVYCNKYIFNRYHCCYSLLLKSFFLVLFLFQFPFLLLIALLFKTLTSNCVFVLNKYSGGSNIEHVPNFEWSKVVTMLNGSNFELHSVTKQSDHS